MSKEIHALKDRSGQIFWPATATDAVIHPKTRLPLTDHIEKYNLTGDNTVDSLEDGIAKLITLGVSQHLGVQIEILNTSGVLEEWTYYDPNELFSSTDGWRKGGEIDDTLDATSENPVQNKVIYQAILDNEEITAAALADLDDRIEDLSDGKADLVNGTVPSAQLPSYVDDVLEYASLSAFPATGESGKIYVALDTNLTYRWSGSTYIEISKSLALGETSTTAYAGDKGKQNADNIALLQTNLGNAVNYGKTKYLDLVYSNGTDENNVVTFSEITLQDIDSNIQEFYPDLVIRYQDEDSNVINIPVSPTLTATEDTGASGKHLIYESSVVRVGSSYCLAKIYKNGSTKDAEIIKLSSSEIQSIPEYQESTPLTIGDTYDQAFGKVNKIISDNETVTAAALSDLNNRVLDLSSDVTSLNSDVATLNSISTPLYISVSYGGTEDGEEGNGVVKFEGTHDYSDYEFSSQYSTISVTAEEITNAINSHRNIYINGIEVVSITTQEISGTTYTNLFASRVNHDSIEYAELRYKSTSYYYRSGSWEFRDNIYQIKESIVILPGSIILGLLDPNANVESNNYYAMDMKTFASSGQVMLLSNTQLYEDLVGGINFGSDANLIRPVLFFEEINQLTTIISLLLFKVKNIGITLYSNARDLQSLVLEAKGSQHIYTATIPFDSNSSDKVISIVESDEEYSNQEIDDLLDEIGQTVSTSINDLNERVEDLEDLKDVVEENEKTTATALIDLNDKVRNIKDQIPVLYSELKDLRDNGELIPGKFYRIIDYICTTSQENTRAMLNQFDIIVFALSPNTLAENAWADHHEGDTYFSDCNLGAWELKYSLDNSNIFTWANQNGGRGVIYYMKDEFGNECPYDFKNIQFRRYNYNYLVNNLSFSGSSSCYIAFFFAPGLMGFSPNSSAYNFYYTFSIGSGDQSNLNNTCTDSSLYRDSKVFNNKINEYKQDTSSIYLNNIVFCGTENYCNTFDDNCNNMTIGSRSYSNTFGKNTSGILIGGQCDQNIFEGGNYSITLGGPYCQYNKFEKGSHHILLRSYSNNNVFGAQSTYICFGTYFSEITIGKNCQYFNNSNSSNTNSFYRNINIESGNNYIQLNCTSTTSSSQYYQNVTIAQGTNNANVGSGTKTINDSNVNQDFQTIYKPANCQEISV